MVRSTSSSLPVGVVAADFASREKKQRFCPRGRRSERRFRFLSSQILLLPLFRLVVESDDGANDDDGVVVDAREHTFVAILSNVFFYLGGKNNCFCSAMSCSGEVTTRARKKKRDKAEERDSFVSSLWELIVKCDDVSFQHILPRLNSNDIKFLYGVNKETRKLIKRSSRKGELKERFKVREMSSISTLEVAWENRSLWPTDSERYFCSEVAGTNKLELLKWAREEKKCKWSSHTIYAAAGQGNLEMVKYCVANKCPIDWRACAYAAENGHLEVLKCLREEAKAPWDFSTAEWAAENGHLHILEYLVERKYDEYNERACMHAAKYGHLDCLKYLHETAKAPWNYKAVRFANKKNHSECVQYLLDNNCPLPPGWRYEDGVLHTS